MLRLASYDVVFQEIPGEVTLALNLANCPNRCEGCHSPHLQEDKGTVLDEDGLSGLLASYGSAVTCVCFLGGDAEPVEVAKLAAFLKRRESSAVDGSLSGAVRGIPLKVGWYSGCDRLPDGFDLTNFDYVKIGSYKQELGGLASSKTNQRMYRLANGKMEDITALFWEKPLP